MPGSVDPAEALRAPGAPDPLRSMLAERGATLIDERSGVPLRRILGGLLRGASAADFAIARVRLAGIDLSEGELGGVRRCRVLIGRLDAGMLGEAEDAAADPGDQRRNLQALLAFLRSGRLRVRSAGRQAWTPDFSVLRGDRRAPSDAGDIAADVAVVGAHYFGRPPPGGPSFTCILTDASAVARAGARFERIWGRGYDVGGVVTQTLERLLGRG